MGAGLRTPWIRLCVLVSIAVSSSLVALAAEDPSALLKRSQELATQNLHEQAALVAERALKEAEAIYGTNDRRLIAILARLAQSYRALGRAAQAKDAQTRAKSIQRNNARIEDTAPRSEAKAYEPEARAFSGAERRAARGSNSGSRGVNAAPSMRASSPSGQAVAEGHALLPQFPWPPPAASTTYVLPRSWFEKLPTLGEVSDGILSALAKSGYVERSFFRTEADGVALVTRLEHIGKDGTPLDPRWPTGLEADRFDLVNFLRGLFFVSPGRYRVIVFVMQDRPFAQAKDKATEEQAKDWLKTGANELPAEIAKRPFKDGTCTALIYEFASDGSTVRVVDSDVSGLQHLEKAGLVGALEAMNRRQD